MFGELKWTTDTYPVCAEDRYPADVVIHKVVSSPHILLLKSIPRKGENK
jgi:hypothetical protein